MLDLLSSADGINGTLEGTQEPVACYLPWKENAQMAFFGVMRRDPFCSAH